MRNAQFSTTMQKLSNLRSFTKDIQLMFDMLNNQQFILNIDLIQTAYTCNDSIIVDQLVGYTLTQLSISNCQTSQNGSILSLTIPLPTHSIDLRLMLPGIKTVGAIRLGLNGSSAVSADNR
jgi:hypothetical protein